MKEIFLAVINRRKLTKKKPKLSTEWQTFEVARQIHRSAVRQWKVVYFRCRTAADIMKILVVR